MKKKAKNKAKARTQVCFLLDETQSMLTRKEETIKGFNGYLDELKKDKGDEVLFTLTLFNRGGIRIPYKATPIKEVKYLTDETYSPQDWTPLYDAIGRTACELEKNIEKDDLIIFTILTDGEENSSKEYKLQAIKDLIRKKEKEGNWKFSFLGVGIDAFAGGETIGISSADTYAVGVTGNSAMAMYCSLSSGTSNLRSRNVSKGAQWATSATLMSDADREKIK